MLSLLKSKYIAKFTKQEKNNGKYSILIEIPF